MALPGVAALPPDHGNGEAGNRGPMVPSGLSALLELAVARRATTREQGNPQIDPPDVPCQPALGAPRIHGELLKLRIKVSQSTVAKYMLGRPHSPSSYLAQLPAQKPRTGRCRHRHVYRSFGNVPATIRDVILAHDRHKIVRFDVTQHPTVGWLSRQVNRGVPMG